MYWRYGIHLNFLLLFKGFKNLYTHANLYQIFCFCHVAVLYTIEFQKRGLPYCHTLLWIDSKDKIQSPEEVENFILAELPEKESDLEAYRVVADLMMYGPCGNAKPSAPCLQEGNYTKNFLKKYNNHTFFDKDGHVYYRRRNTPAYVAKGEFKLDNTYMVPSNRLLCQMFHAHINVEYCGWEYVDKISFQVYLKKNG